METEKGTFFQRILTGDEISILHALTESERNNGLTKDKNQLIRPNGVEMYSGAFSYICLSRIETSEPNFNYKNSVFFTVITKRRNTLT